MISELAKIDATKPIFWILVCYHCIVHILNSSKKNSIFFVSNSDLCSAMLPNYLRTYSSALCQTRALAKALKKQNNGQSVPKILVWMHAFDWPEQTLKIHIQYSRYFACNNDLCRGVLTNILGDIFLSFFATFEP